MLGNRTRSPVAIARNLRAVTAQNVAANIVRANSDAAVSTAAAEALNDAVLAQQEQIGDLNTRVGDLEDIP